MAYRDPRAETTFEISTFRNDRDDADETFRLSSALSERFLLAHRWSAGVVLGYDRNDELDLSGRATVIGFGARALVRSSHIDSWAAGGLVATRERYFSTGSTSDGFEGFAALQFNAFRYDYPKLDVTFTSEAFPSFSIGGRVTLQNDLRVSYELIKDFMLTVTVFDSYDSKPKSAEASKNDFGTTLALSWTF